MQIKYNDISSASEEIIQITAESLYSEILKFFSNEEKNSNENPKIKNMVTDK